MSDESYPEDLRYHEAHDWVRVDGDTATFGITWYAQDTLGEVVFYSPPEVGEQVAKDADYGELESTKAVSALVAPLSGEVVAVNEALDGNERTVNDDPYGEGWLIKVRLSEPARGRRAHVRRRLSRAARVAVSFTSLTDADRAAMLAAIGVSSIDELFADIPADVRLGRALRRRPGADRGRAVGAPLASSRRATRAPAASSSFLGAGIYDHYVPAVVDAVLQRGELLTAYTPYQPEMSQGTLQAIFEYQTAICELTGMDVSNASGYDGATVAADACYVVQADDRALAGGRHRDAQPAGAPGRAHVRPRVRHGGRRGAAHRRHDRPRPVRGGVRGRRLRDLPPAQLLRLPRAGPRAGGGSGGRRGACDRPRRPDDARGAGGARRLRVRARDRRGPVGREPHLLRRPALRLPGRPLRLHPQAARADRRRDARPGRPPRLRAHAADARAAHPPREGHLEHHHEPDAARGGRARVPELARAGGAARRRPRLPVARRARQAPARPAARLRPADVPGVRRPRSAGRRAT